MKKHFFCILLLIAISAHCFSAVTIEGSVTGKEVFIEYYSPIDGFFNVSLNLSEAEMNDRGNFRIVENIKTSGFFILYSGGYPIWIFAFPNDKISIEISYNDSFSKFPSKITIHGPNAEGQHLYNSSYSGTKKFLLLSQLFKQLPDNYKTLKEKVVRVIDSTLQSLNKLLVSKKISIDFYKKIEWDVKSVIASEAIIQFKRLINEKRKNNSDSSLILHLNNDLDSFKNSIYLQIDPTNINILTSTSGLIYSDHFFRDIEKGKVSSQVSYDSVFEQIKGRQYLGYTSNKRFLEGIWGNSLYFSFRVGEVNESEFNLFCKYFPQSKFIPFMRAELQEQNNNLAIIPEDKKSLQDKIKIVKDEEFNSLKEITKKYFKGNLVLVDLWATWCVPCLFETPYIKKLQPLFEKHKVSLLSISIDGKTQKAKWENYILAKEMEGTHILANEDLINNLKGIISDQALPIPRFLLVDKEGNVLNNNFLRPSDKKFEAELIKLL